MELLNIIHLLQFPLLMHFTLGIDEYQLVAICMEDGFFVENLMVPLLQCLHENIEILVIGVVINLGLHNSF
jgi:hypothetical protein